MSRRYAWGVCLAIAGSVLAMAPAIGQADAPKWFTLDGGVETIVPNGTGANFAGVGDNFTMVSANGTIVVTCLVFTGGTITQNGAGIVGSDSTTVFGQIGGLYAAKPCTVTGLLGGGCTAGFAASATTTPVAFTTSLPWATVLAQLAGTNIDKITKPSVLITFAGGCAVAGSSLAFSAPLLQAFLTNLVAPPANRVKECNNVTAPQTLQETFTPFPQSQLGSGTLNGTQGTNPTATTALGGTIEIWKVPAAVSLTSGNMDCTGLAVLLTTA